MRDYNSLASLVAAGLIAPLAHAERAAGIDRAYRQGKWSHPLWVGIIKDEDGDVITGPAGVSAAHVWALLLADEIDSFEQDIADDGIYLLDDAPTVDSLAERGYDMVEVTVFTPNRVSIPGWCRTDPSGPQR